MLELEGTWEEIAAQATELAGRRVRVAVLDVEESEAANATHPAARAFAEAMKELEESDADLPLTSATDTVRIIREGRAGAMYGYDPYE